MTCTSGGGIIGCTAAYYLTRHPTYDPKLHTVTLVEATRIAGGASGKAGGLLAIWAYPSNIVPLSFQLHEELAREHNGEETWGYRRVTCGNLEVEGRDWSDQELPKGHSLGKRRKSATSGKVKGVPEDLDWISQEQVKGYSEIGDTSATAQVHPYYFTTSMIRLAEERGVKVIIGSVTELNYVDLPGKPHQIKAPLEHHSDPPSPALSSGSLDSSSSKSARRKGVNTVVYVDNNNQTYTLPASDIILAAGPWTARLYPSVPIRGLRAHSVTITPTEPVSAYALFTKITVPQRPHSPLSSSARSGSRPPVTPMDPEVSFSPEIYARPNEIYVCGEGDMDVELPASTSEVVVDENRCDELISQVASISDQIREGRVTRKQACYLPIIDIGGLGPLIGETGIKGLLLASGHSCWGINNAPATGLILSELVFDGKAKSADIRTMDPRRVI